MQVYDSSLHDYFDNFMIKRKEDKWKKKSEKENVSFPDISIRLKMLKKIIGALVFLQSKNIFHLDLKPSNIMINTNGNIDWDGQTLKLIG